jgi:hypothetical protein
VLGQGLTATPRVKGQGVALHAAGEFADTPNTTRALEKKTAYGTLLRVTHDRSTVNASVGGSSSF